MLGIHQVGGEFQPRVLLRALVQAEDPLFPFPGKDERQHRLIHIKTVIEHILDRLPVHCQQLVPRADILPRGGAAPPLCGDCHAHTAFPSCSVSVRIRPQSVHAPPDPSGIVFIPYRRNMPPEQTGTRAPVRHILIQK